MKTIIEWITSIFFPLLDIRCSYPSGELARINKKLLKTSLILLIDTPPTFILK